MADYITKTQFGVKKPYPPQKKKTPSTHNKVKDVSPEQIRVAINLISC